MYPAKDVEQPPGLERRERLTLRKQGIPKTDPQIVELPYHKELNKVL